MNADLSSKLWLKVLIVQQTYQQTFPSLPFPLPFLLWTDFYPTGSWLGDFYRFRNLSNIWKYESENKTEKSHNLKAQYFIQCVLTG